MSFNQNSSFGFGSSGGGGGGGTLTGALNGLSLNGINVVFGQDVGQGGNPALLTSHREIPQGAFNLSFTGAGNILIGGAVENGSKIRIVGPGSTFGAPSALWIDSPSQKMLTLNYANNITGSNTYGIAWRYNGDLNAQIYAEADTRVLHFMFIPTGVLGNGTHSFQIATNADGSSSETVMAIFRNSNGSGMRVAAQYNGTQAETALVINSTFNTTGSPIAFGMNITNTASGAATMLADWKIGGLTKFRVAKDGATTLFGSVTVPYRATAVTTSFTTTDYTIDCTTGTYNLGLPDAIGIAGKLYVAKNTGSGVITMTTVSGQTVDGTTPPVINAGEVLRFQSTGANWIMI